MNRREFIPLGAAAILTGYAGFQGGRRSVPKRDSRSAVTLRRFSSYDEDLAGPVLESIQSHGLEVAGKRILLKPHFAAAVNDEYTNTHVSVVAAAFAAFQELGAAEVRIADAPAFHRDAFAVAEAAGYRGRIPNFDDIFVDLNGDDVSPVEGWSRSQVYLPDTALRADLVVSIAKLKTDTQFGASLSMTNLFGLLPGALYGWPTEKIHGLGTPSNAVELTRIFRRSFAIVDGIWGMEGDAPANGSAKKAGFLAMGPDLAAVDATCCRAIGLDPDDIEYLQIAADRQGVIEESRIEQRGDSLRNVQTQFRPATLETT